ncbi:hypothetical protein [Streptomyces virginiae]|uniref:hypothetical protein n=1 Tax=Streptomyces virginiae TaxID=1961 RepID=UPI0034408AA2
MGPFLARTPRQGLTLLPDLRGAKGGTGGATPATTTAAPAAPEPAGAGGGSARAVHR